MDKEILDSWKAISDYLDRDIRTCARWEKELGLPVYRINNHSPRSKVFAYKSEIDEWLHERSNHREIRKTPFIQKKWTIIGLITTVVLLLVVSVSLYIANGKLPSQNAGNFSIAFLPFESINFSEHEQFIAEGIQNDIFANLSTLNNIKVIPSVLFSKEDESQKNLKNITEKFNVSHALITKLEKNENTLKIHVQLMRINDDRILWNEESEETLLNMFSLPRDICLKICKRLNARKEITALAFNNGLTRDYEAYNYYLKGNHILNRANAENDDPWNLYLQGKYFQDQWSEESNVRAIKLFSRAIKIDESFSRAYIGLARCFANYVNFNWDNDEKWLHKAEEHLERAAAINSEDPEYYSALIQVRLLKYYCFNKNTKNEAFELAKKAVENYPGYSQLFAQLGHCFYFNFGEFGNDSDFTKAFELYQNNYYLHPHHINNIIFAEILILNEEFNNALAVCSGIEDDEASLMADYRMGETYYYMGDLERSKAVFQQFDSVNDLDYQIGALFYLGMIAAQRRDSEEVGNILTQIDALTLKEFEYFENKLKLASIHMGTGQKELGYKYLEDFFDEEKAKKTRYIYHKYINIDKNFDDFRGEARFKNIIQ